MLNGLAKRVGAEMVGTFALVFAGCGAIVVNANGGALGHVGVALTFGLVVMVMVYATGHLSGAHFNPAVTVAFASIGRFPWTQVAPYVAGQVVAALAAAFMLRGIFGTAHGLGATTPSAGLVACLLIEVILTAFLMFVITAVATDARATGTLAGVAIGGTVALGALFGGPVSGASLNPARSLGPGAASMEFTGFWLYIVGPMLGALIGAWTYHLLRCEVEVSTEKPAEVRGCC